MRGCQGRIHPQPKARESSGPLPAPSRAPAPPGPPHSPGQFIYSSGGHSPGGLLTQHSGADGSCGSKFQARNNLMTCLGKDFSAKIPRTVTELSVPAPRAGHDQAPDFPTAGRRPRIPAGIAADFSFGRAGMDLEIGDGTGGSGLMSVPSRSCQGRDPQAWGFAGFWDIPPFLPLHFPGKV